MYGLEAVMILGKRETQWKLLILFIPAKYGKAIRWPTPAACAQLGPSR